MAQTIDTLEAKWIAIRCNSFNDRPTDYQRLHRELTTVRMADGYRTDDLYKVKAVLDDVESRMKPKLSFLGGSTCNQ